MGNIARDLTFDPIEQKVYGIFSVGNLEARYLIGRMNLDTEGEDFRVTDLVELDDATNQVAIASDARGTIYTIGVDGKLNRLDKENNTLVEIGPTGVRDIEVLYPQSATIDLESGVFYWAALLTDPNRRFPRQRGVRGYMCASHPGRRCACGCARAVSDIRGWLAVGNRGIRCPERGCQRLDTFG